MCARMRPSVSMSWVLGSQVCTAMPSLCNAEDGTQDFDHARQAILLATEPSLQIPTPIFLSMGSGDEAQVLCFHRKWFIPQPSPSEETI